MKQMRLFSVLLLLSTASFAEGLKKQSLSLRQATVSITGNSIEIDTGRVRRTLKWTGHGFLTTQLENNQTGKVWGNSGSSTFLADWQMQGQREPQQAELVDLQVRKSTDEGFAAEMLEVVAELNYPEEKLALRWRAWIWPDANGIRTQILVKKLDGFSELKKQWFNGVDKSEFRVVHTSSELDPSQIDQQAEGRTASERKKWKPDLQQLFDNSAGGTGWITQPTIEPPSAPSEIIIDLGKMMDVRAIGLQHIDDYKMEGCIEDFKLYLSPKADKWSKAIAQGRLERVKHPQIIPVEETKARYLRIVAPPTTKQNYNFWVTRLGEVYVYTKETPLPRDLSPRVDYVPCTSTGTRIYAGLYSDTQNRNRPDTPLLREEKMSGPLPHTEIVDWASIAAVESEGEGVMMVKESHKTPNQRGSDTGVFQLTSGGLANTGWGRLPYDGQITDQWGELWASWCIVYSGGDSERTLAIKEFDRTRFSYDMEKEYLVKCNSWGTHHTDAAAEKMVLQDLGPSAEIGVEDYQIDDGWQKGWKTKKWIWRPDPELYPNGWKTVRKKAEELDIQLSIWQAAMPISLEELKLNYDDAGFIGHKLDFAVLDTPKRREDTVGKVRKFIQHTDHQARANWDVTEVPARFGYFWAREYGRLWLKNAKPQAPLQSIHIPSQVLRGAWQLAHYMNMRMIELPISNPKKVLKQYSDTHLHPIEYVIAETFAGVPVFFESMYTYDADQQQRMRALLDVYKQHRKAMWECIEMPIGECPDNSTITGFQLVSSDKKSGYLLIYRERLNTTGSANLPLHFMNQVKWIETENIITGEKEIVSLSNGVFPIAIPEAPGFRLLKYRIQ
jgi:hypothetical protein